MSKTPRRRQQRSYFFWSILLHGLLLTTFVVGFQFRQSLPVFELTPHANDTINAVVLGETKESKIMPKQEPSLLPQAKPILEKTTPKPEKTQPPIKVAKTEDKVEPIAKKSMPKKTSEASKEPPPEKKEAIALAKKPPLPVKEKPTKPTDMKSILDEFAAETKAHKKKEQASLKEKWERELAKAQRQDIEKTFRESALLSDAHTKSTVSRAVADGVIDKYKALIIQSISEQWRVPAGVSKQAVSELTIRLAPGGMVLDVKVSRSSGNPALDRSARSAVMKSSPLPVPKDAKEFEAFREFVLKVKPEYVMDNELG